ncbi:hypothetical protein ANO11243_055080 [Dothideomycetidae sp. 11243]|nr:hypothetical protein ANO11243_055080 [fungal sp. No.11243]
MARPRGEDEPRERDHKRRRYSSDYDSDRPARRYEDDSKGRSERSDRRDDRPRTRDGPTGVPRDRDRGQDRHRDRGLSRSRDRPKERRREEERDHDRQHRDGRDYRDRHRDDRKDRETDDRLTKARHRHRHRSRSRSRSRSPASAPTQALTRHRDGPLPSQSASFALTSGTTPPPEKQKPNFAPTGLLAREANTVATSRAGRSVVLKYHEPAEARKPPASQAWRLYRFAASGKKEDDDVVPLAERSCWLFGRETAVVDVLLDEPTAGKQHAVVQFRHSVSRDEYGDKIERVRPYVIDLESKAGTRLNGERIEAGRYVELRDADVLVFGANDRDGRADEWVLMLPPS